MSLSDLSFSISISVPSSISECTEDKSAVPFDGLKECGFLPVSCGAAGSIDLMDQVVVAHVRLPPRT